MDNDMFKRLCAPFQPSAVKWRVGRAFWPRSSAAPTQGQETTGIVLAYIDARDVMDRLDEVIGFGNWDCAYKCYQEAKPEGKTETIHVATLNLRFSDHWMMSYDGVSDESDFEAIKGGASGAFKRAAVYVGIGRYLYGLGETKAKMVYRGGGWVIREDEYPRLEKVVQEHFANYAAPQGSTPSAVEHKEKRDDPPVVSKDPVPSDSKSVQPVNTYEFEKYRKIYTKSLIEDLGKEEASKKVAHLLDTFGVSKYAELVTEDQQRKFIAALVASLKRVPYGPATP